ncbi:hypothetical protein [Peribacillus sp. NPDC097895]|uniref:hypothetical protein n=1 Tax=Peribacillus sp. NPDC097895 TaxID=3390619 RepID=UPI003D07E568
MRQMCMYCFKWADIDTLTPLFEQGRDFVNYYCEDCVTAVMDNLFFHTNMVVPIPMYANNQEPTSHQAMRVKVKR